MKVNVQKNILGALIVLILAVAIYSGKQIGDRVTRYQAYKSLQAVTELARPIHASITGLQIERRLITQYLVHRSPELFSSLKEQIPMTDKSLQEFAQKLKSTQMLLLSIPETELEETRKSINLHRNSLNKKSFSYKDNKEFYSYVIGDFLTFLDKMYEFADDPEFQPVVNYLLDSEFYLETVSQELMVVTHQISQPEIQPGEIPLIRQMITDQIFQYEKLTSTNDPELAKAITGIEASAEKARFTELQKRFGEENPDLQGSPEEASEYANAGQAYLKKYVQLNDETFARLEATAEEGRSGLKAEMTKAGVSALAIIMVLIGLFILIQKKQVEA